MSSNSIHIHYYKTVAGELIIGSFEQQLCLLDYRFRKARSSLDARISKGLNADFVETNDETIEQAKSQLNDYFARKRTQFDLPLLLVGTTFQKTVWQALLAIPFGQTCSYLELAKSINNEQAVRAVANANGANALSIVVPCHRVIEKNGGLGGYAGGLETKKRLLNLEQNDLFQQ